MGAIGASEAAGEVGDGVGAVAAQKPRNKTPPGECAACWRRAQGLPQGASKHDAAKRCSKSARPS